MDFIEPAYAQLQGPPRQIASEFDLSYDNLGLFVNTLTPIAFSIAAVMIMFYFIIAAFELITSQGDKAHIVSARSKIYHSIIGFVLLIVLFVVMQYIIPAILGQDPANPTFKVI